MALPVWPAGLPYQGDVNVHKVNNLGLAPLKSPMQSGRTRMRPQFTLQVTAVSWMRDFLPAELVIFRNFVRNTLGQGTSRFTMPVWDGGTRTFPNKTVWINDGLYGISEADMVSVTTVSMTLMIEGF
jgi:hypothetical protein